MLNLAGLALEARLVFGSSSHFSGSPSCSTSPETRCRMKVWQTETIRPSAELHRPDLEIGAEFLCVFKNYFPFMNHNSSSPRSPKFNPSKHILQKLLSGFLMGKFLCDARTCQSFPVARTATCFQLACKDQLFLGDLWLYAKLCNFQWKFTRNTTSQQIPTNVFFAKPLEYRAAYSERLILLPRYRMVPSIG